MNLELRQLLKSFKSIEPIEPILGDHEGRPYDY